NQVEPPVHINSAFQLKSILKQSGGLSLSEVLQQKNVSLSDLLEGKQIALAALFQNSNSKREFDSKNKTKSSVEVVTTQINNFENENLSHDQTESPIQREKKEYRIRNFIRSKNTPMISESSGFLPTRKNDFSTRQKLQDDTSNNNLIENINLYKDEDTRVFPSVETKQMALNPVVPVHREKLERRPIKNVIPRIRPDFTNSKVVKPEDSFVNNKRRKFNTTISKEQERDKLAPNINFRDRIPGKRFESSEKNVTSTNTVKKSFRDQFVTSTTPKNIDIIRNRLHVKPRIRLPSRTASRIKITTTTEFPTTFAVFTDDFFDETTKPLFNSVELTTTKLEVSDVETVEKNIQEKKSKDNFSTPREGMPASRIQKIQQKSKHSTPTTVNITNRFFNITTSYKLPTTAKPKVIKSTQNSFHLATESSEIDLLAEKNEIIQLLEDRRHGLKLNKVLQQSNMTIDDLMEHRKRGSSHVHLQELLKTKRKLAEKTKAEDKIDIVTAFENFPRFNIGNLKSIQPDDIKTDSQGFSYFTSIINIRPTDEIYKEARALQDIHKYAKESNRQYKTLTFNEDDNEDNRNSTEIQLKSLSFPELNSESKIEIRQNILRETTNQRSGGVKSAIIVSSCIVITTLVLFSFLLAVYRWRQSRKRKLNYTESYEIAKGRLPIIHKEPLKDKKFSPVLCAKHRNSSGRISRLTTMDPNSSEIHNYLGWGPVKNVSQ
ncbi:uncharacterized protein LOC134828058, partial [Culicoides brevitarsis]|uniref:uncharacterized protein LOC134828058 n=1 Tax=Culicoides brevitarsis TaxID=469753 RepID=UPI00307B18FE